MGLEEVLFVVVGVVEAEKGVVVLWKEAVVTPRKPDSEVSVQ